MVRVRDPEGPAGITVASGLDLFTAKMVARVLNAENCRLNPDKQVYEFDLYMVELDADR